MAGVSRTVEVNVPIAEFFKVITDYKGYCDFIPEMKKVREVRRTGNVVEMTYTIEVDAGVAKKEISYTLKHTETAPGKMSWSMIKGDMMKSNDGGWELTAVGEGKTKAVYSIDIGFGMLVPKTVSNLLQERGLPKLMEQFKGRAESLHKK